MHGETLKFLSVIYITTCLLRTFPRSEVYKLNSLKNVLKEANIQLMIFICPIYGRECVYFNHFHVLRAITSTVKNVVKEKNQWKLRVRYSDENNVYFKYLHFVRTITSALEQTS